MWNKKINHSINQNRSQVSKLIIYLNILLFLPKPFISQKMMSLHRSYFISHFHPASHLTHQHTLASPPKYVPRDPHFSPYCHHPCANHHHLSPDFSIASSLFFPLHLPSFIHSSHYGLNNLFKKNITSCHSSNKYSMWSCMICFLPLLTSSWATFFLTLHAPATPAATQFLSIACCCSLGPSHTLFPWPEMSSFPTIHSPLLLQAYYPKISLY